ncbi:MAG: succinylglutamate desuccinylase [Syntrophales bacterium]|nr:succinylglutamate desuccinylase [Syntrophales bacterium]MDD5640258.1 succinylglutamate desuccinylase [Syntrophales bacterium]
MKKKFLAALLISMVTVLLALSGAFAAKLLCVSHQELKGETTVAKCVDQGMEFAIMDAQGFVRILTPREIEMTRSINPKAFETKAFGVNFHHLAPVIPPLPVSPEVSG